MSEPFPDVVRRSWLLFSVLLLLSGMVGWSIWTQHKLVGKIAAMENILSTPIPAEYEEDLKRIESQGAEALEQYQKCALEKIRDFEREFQRVSGEVSQASMLPNGWEDRWEDKHHQEIQEAIISHLLPIDLDLLELPVLKLYDQEFERGWGKLGGIKRQTIVAEKSILTPKKPLLAVLEDQSCVTAKYE